ncbi:MAG: hypothetical protein K2I39_00990 [Muribaculaceae bacterium]|nr:hypothetical protein [Muribaculaceae bacterium]
MTKLYTFLILAAAASAPVIAQEAVYENPKGLRYIGTIEDQRINPACSYLSRNPINENAFLWTPVGSTILYTDQSTGGPKAWSWVCDGATPSTLTKQDAQVEYKTAGTYNFPAETVTFGSGQKTYAPDLKIKVGGVAELCLADTREWINTYALGHQKYSDINGVLGGANKLDIEGVGNFYMMPGNEIFLDGVNVYLLSKPTKWPEGRKITVTVYMSEIDPSTGSVSFTAPLRTIESGSITLDKIKTKEDGAYVPIVGGAVMPIRFNEPVDLYGKPFIFISVSGWGTDYTKEDMTILMDIQPNQIMRPQDAQNILAHNSFARLKGETDYLRPVSYYGGNYGSFMICPLVRGYETPQQSGIANVATDTAASVKCTVSGGTATLTGADGAFTVYSISGAVQYSGTIDGGQASFDTAGWAHGIYIVRDAAGNTAKFKV